ncbi:MAG: hypothetical protein ACRD6W_18665 [Nitrososphaerales archaeon]
MRGPAARSRRRGLHAAQARRRLWRLPLALWIAGGLLVGSGSTAFAYLSATGSGSGPGVPGKLVSLKVTARTPTATLMPGMTGTLYYTVSNTNTVPVTLTELLTIEATTSACGAYLKPALKLPYAVLITVSRRGMVTTSLTTVVKLTTKAPTSCQGMTFTVTLHFSGKTS